jgi:hypothetical protein
LVLVTCVQHGVLKFFTVWSPEHKPAPALSPVGPRVRSHAIRRRLFIALMTAAHISPNIFSLRNFLSNIHGLFLTVHATSFIYFIHYIYTHIYIFYLHFSFTILLLRIFLAGRLPSVPCVQYNSDLEAELAPLVIN